MVLGIDRFGAVCAQTSGLLAWCLENLRDVPRKIQGGSELLLSKQLMRLHALEGAGLGHRDHQRFCADRVRKIHDGDPSWFPSSQ